MKKILVLIILSLTTSAYANCDLLLKESNTCIQYSWLKGPFLNERHERNFSELIVKFFDADDIYQNAISKEDVIILPWMIMPTREHGTRPVTTTLLEDGSYRVSEIFLKKMMGHWEIRFINSINEKVLGSFIVAELKNLKDNI